ncbi:hypothetical protein MSAN_02135800 [Mycena sanguinolenta]|uniref:Uncharacterized protein n=1 Tax=Mycena sanguinolenta TaxID=230812 RepID=A0A8H6XHQ3_9AGAR|nr:hypothetical protein MSAN_02135800 [Mycena sanguinolenta]
MDDHSQPEPEFTHSSICEPESALPASGMFSHSRNFTVRGKNLTNITNHYAGPSLPSDFRMIPMRDIDLRHQIRVDECTSVAYLPQRPRACVRRIYSAKARVDGRRSNVTVAMYQGNVAEEDWRQDIETYIHPNIIQLCGAASSNGMHAAIFHDDLIPLRHFLDRYRESHFKTVYIYACFVYTQPALSHLSKESGFHGGIQLSLFCLPTKILLTGLYKLDTSLDWPTLRRAYPS